MSRIGRQPIAIPAGVQVSVEASHVAVSGPLGALEQDFHPDMRILLTSGYLAGSVAMMHCDFPIIDKPYQQADLASKVRAVLDGDSQVMVAAAGLG